MTEQSNPALTWTFVALFALWGIIKFIAFVYLFQCALRDWKRSWNKGKRK